MTHSSARLISQMLVTYALLAQAPGVREHPCELVVPNGRCGSVTVLEDRSHLGGRKIPIAFLQVHSTAKDRDSAAWIDLAGGPGVADTAGAAELLRVFAYVLKHRDLVLYDQRGTGASNPLHCDPHSHVPPDEAGDFLPELGVRRCYEQMSARADLTKYNTAEAVADLDQLRAALGYDQIVLHALSYGTRLAQAYIQEHPEHVRAAVFEGALRPGARIPLGFAKGTQGTLEAVLEDCRRDPGCKPVASRIDLPKIAGLKEISFRLAGPTVHLTPPQFFEAFRSLLYDGEGPRSVPMLLAELSHGDTHQVARLYQAVYRDDSQFSWPLWLSVTCAEDTPFIREDQIGPATQGPLAGDYRIRQQQRACKFWPVPKRDPAVGRPTDIPVLLMEGQLDLVTPPWPTDEFQQYFPHGRQVILPLTGHMPTGLDGLECLDNIEEQFLLRLDNTSLDIGCRSNIHRKPFLVEEEKEK